MDEKHKIHPSELLEFNTTTFSNQSKEPVHIERTTQVADSQSSHGNNRLDRMDSEVRRFSFTGLNLPEIPTAALEAAQSERKMTFRQGLRQYPRAIFWSAVLSLAIVGESFDTTLISSFYAYPEFRRSYGVLASDGSYQITTKWQSALNNGSVVGSIIGLLANGFLTERFGYRGTLLGAVMALALFIFLAFFAFNIETLLAAQVLCGIPWGICSTLTTSYAAEVMPLALRGYLTANVNLCWLWGQLIALGTLRGLLPKHTQWSYRIPFALQWVWIVIVAVAVYLSPESPWYLVRKGRLLEAKKSLNRLSNKSNHFDADATIAMMKHTNDVEIQLNGCGMRNDLSYLECFRGANLRRTEIACAIFGIQVLCGLPVIGFAAYVYTEIGFGSARAFDLSLGMQALAIAASIGTILWVRYFGRRTLYLVGLAAGSLTLLVGGILGSLTQTNATLWGTAAVIFLFIFIFDSFMGPLTYTIIAEVPSTRLRVNTLVLARISYNLVALFTNVLFQHMINPLSWNWKGKMFYFWAASSALCFVYCWFRLPETKGLTYHELDILFEKKAGTRKFKAIRQKLEERGYFGMYDEEGPDTRHESDATVAWHK